MLIWVEWVIFMDCYSILNMAVKKYICFYLSELFKRILMFKHAARKRKAQVDTRDCNSQ